MSEVTEDRVRSWAKALPALPRIVAAGNAAFPGTLVDVLDRQLERYRLFMINAPRGIPARDGVVHETPFVGPGMRGQPGLSYLPSRLSQVPLLFAGPTPPDVVCLHTTRPANGKVSLGIEVNILPGAIEAAHRRGALVLAQTNAAMPYTYGDAEIDVAGIDAFLDVDEPLLQVGLAASRPPELTRLGRVVSDRIVDGSVLQLGIGLVPDAALPGLLERRGLGIWSEMVSDGVMALEAAGCLDPDRPVTASFVLGSRGVYDWVDRHEGVRLVRTETTNDPALIARNPLMVSINTALQVDLFGQANASRVGGRIHSGFGGQTDFITGALHSPGGQALMALRSWHPKANVSAIVPMIDEPVTSFQHTAVITEQGVAAVWGNDERTQAAQLIERAAHPSVRDELWEEARALGLA